MTLFRIFKDDAIDLCTVIKNVPGYRDITIWVLVVALPFVLGPVLTLTLEILSCLRNTISGVSTKDTTTRKQRQCMLTVLSMLVTLSYSTHLLVTEAYLQPVYNLGMFDSLMLKYCIGSMDLILTPLIICLLDIDIRHGVFYIYKRRRTRSITGTLR